MSLENMAPATYVRARAEQLAMQADLETFQRLYLARGINFGSEVGEEARGKFDEFIEPFRETAGEEFTKALNAAREKAQEAYASTINELLGNAGLTGTHDAAELKDDELDAFNQIVAE